MAVSVVMPALEMAQETGKLVAWKKKSGESVTKGEILIEVETDKAVVEIEAGADGTLGGVTAKEGDVVPVGQTIAWLLKPGEAVPAGGASLGAGTSGRKMDSGPAAVAAAPVAPAAPVSVAGARTSPKARRLAREHGVDIGTVRGSGPNGEILAADIMAVAGRGTGAASAAVGAQALSASGARQAQASVLGAARPAPASTQPTARPMPSGSADAVSSIGRIMAERTTQSWTTVPHFFLMRDVDASGLNAARERRIPIIERSHGVKVTHTDLMVAAVARSLRQFPRMNGSWVGSGITLNPEVNVALAMAVENAVVAAVIRNADRLSLGDIAKRRKELSERARANRLQPADIAGGTFTISNLGMMGVDAFTAIIVPPQAGILAVGAITDRVVAVGGYIGVRPTMTLSLSSDHRVVDGARAAEFLNDVVVGLTEPEQFLS
jgi:pyruvate dehydrogenase E2 component (dihydrolipoamide acetyltransferase)